jgi:hypothetical protein
MVPWNSRHTSGIKNNVAISNATNRLYTATTVGSYKVNVTNTYYQTVRKCQLLYLYLSPAKGSEIIADWLS